MKNASVIIPAGGVGKRFGGDLPKQYIELEGIPIILRTLLCFEQSPYVVNIIIAASDEWYAFIDNLISKYNIKKVKDIISGGKERLNSIDNALKSEHLYNSDIILVHDAVRPFVSQKLIKEIIEASDKYGAAIPGINPNETIKSANADNIVQSTLNRSQIWSIQTPQGFRRPLILKAYQNAIRKNIFGTDDSSLVEAIAHKVKIIPGEPQNIKITTPFDMSIAGKILKTFK